MGKTGYKRTERWVYKQACIHRSQKLAATYVTDLLYTKNSEVISIKLKYEKAH